MFRQRPPLSRNPRVLLLLTSLLISGCGDFMGVMPAAGNKRRPVAPSTTENRTVSPDPEVSRTVAILLQEIQDPRIKDDVVTYAGIFGAMADIIERDQQLRNTAMIFNLHDKMRTNIGLDPGRYKGFTDLAGGYLEKRVGKTVTVLTPESRKAAVDIYRAIHVGCVDAAIQIGATVQR